MFSPLSPLPPELLVTVFSHLERHEVERLRLVNSPFYTAAHILLRRSATITQCGSAPDVLPLALSPALRQLDIIGHTCPPRTLTYLVPFLPSLKLLRIHWDHERWSYEPNPPVLCPSLVNLQPSALALRRCSLVLAGCAQSRDDDTFSRLLSAVQHYTFTVEDDSSFRHQLPVGHLSRGVRWLLDLAGTPKNTTVVFRSLPEEQWGKQPQPNAGEQAHPKYSNWALTVFLELAQWVVSRCEAESDLNLTIVNAGALGQEITDGSATTPADVQEAFRTMMRQFLSNIGTPTEEIESKRLAAVRFLTMREYYETADWEGIMETVEAQRWLAAGVV